MISLKRNSKLELVEALGNALVHLLSILQDKPKTLKWAVEGLVTSLPARVVFI